MRVNSLDYKRPEEQHGILWDIAPRQLQQRDNSLDCKRQCCGSASLWCRSESWFFFNSDPDPDFFMRIRILTFFKGSNEDSLPDRSKSSNPYWRLIPIQWGLLKSICYGLETPGQKPQSTQVSTVLYRSALQLKKNFFLPMCFTFSMIRIRICPASFLIWLHSGEA